MQQIHLPHSRGHVQRLKSFEVAPVAHGHVPPFHHRPYPLACLRLEGNHIRQGQSPAVGRGHNRLGQRVLGTHFNGRGQQQQLLLANGRLIHHPHVGHLRLPRGQRAGFVEGHHLDLGRLLHVGPTLEQHAAPRPIGNGRKDRGRGADDNGARGGSHHQGHGPVKGGAERLAQQHGRDEEGQGGHNDHAQGVILLGLVDEALGLGLLALRLLHHLDQLGNGGVFGQLGHAHFQRAGLVDGSGQHGLAHALGHGDGLTGDGRLVHAGTALDNHPVQGNALPRPDHHPIPYAHPVQGQRHHPVTAAHLGLLRPEGHQRPNGVAGAVQGIVLQHVRQREEEQQHRPFKGRAHNGRAHRRQDHQQVYVDGELAQRFQPGAQAIGAAGHVGHGIEDVPQRRRALVVGNQPTKHGEEGDDGEDKLQPVAGEIGPHPAGDGRRPHLLRRLAQRHAQLRHALGNMRLREQLFIIRHRQHAAQIAGRRPANARHLLQLRFQGRRASLTRPPAGAPHAQNARLPPLLQLRPHRLRYVQHRLGRHLLRVVNQRHLLFVGVQAQRQNTRLLIQNATKDVQAAFIFVCLRGCFRLPQR